MSKKTVTGKVSWFGGPNDNGVSKLEGLALWEERDLVFARKKDFYGVELFCKLVDGCGLARRLNPDACYVAMRWDYEETPKRWLREDCVVIVSANGKYVHCRPVDWGPSVTTGRVCDVSPRVMGFLGVKTDDEVTCEVTFVQCYRRDNEVERKWV